MSGADGRINGKDFSELIWEDGREYNFVGYGGTVRQWLRATERLPYNSWGNGSAMRVSAVGFAYDTLEETLEVAKQTADVTHNHPEGVKGAQATAAAIFMARNGATKEEIKSYITEKFNYNLDFTLDEIRPTYTFDVSCQGSVPQSIVAFLESEDYVDAIKKAISRGGDSDTIACITGGIASAYYKSIPAKLIDFASIKLPDAFIEIINEFDNKYM